MSIEKIKAILARTAVYVPADCEGIRISHWDDEMFYGIGEEYGDNYAIDYNEVDLENDMFYELKLIDVSE